MVIPAKDLRTPANLASVPNDKPGWYRWWAPVCALRQLLGVHFDSLLPQLTRGEGQLAGLYYLYVGVAIKESIRARLNWHVNQRHTPSCVKNGTLSTLRQSVSSLICRDQLDEPATNTLIDQLTIEYFPVDLPIGSSEARNLIESFERTVLREKVLPLNIQLNRQPAITDFKRLLKETRKNAKDRAFEENPTVSG